MSLDEAYLDVTENLKGIASATQIAKEIRARISAETELAASAGVSFEATAAVHYADIVVARRQAGNPIEGSDALIAATALRAGASVARRDIADFAGCGLTLIDPWTAA